MILFSKLRKVNAQKYSIAPIPTEIPDINRVVSMIFRLYFILKYLCETVNNPTKYKLLRVKYAKDIPNNPSIGIIKYATTPAATKLTSPQIAFQ